MHLIRRYLVHVFPLRITSSSYPTYCTVRGEAVQYCTVPVTVRLDLLLVWARTSKLIGLGGRSVQCQEIKRRIN
jgi:hypothetical protein